MDTVKKLINGTYVWLYTHYKDRGIDTILYSQNTGKIVRYVFDENGTLNYYENLKLLSSSNYTIDYEFKVSGYYQDSSTMIIAFDKNSGVRQFFFRMYLCNDSAIFYNPFSALNSITYLRRYH